MRFHATDIPGVTIVDIDAHEDERGAFARLYCPNEFSAAAMAFSPRQISLSRNPRAGTLRGMHFQDPPQAEAKFIRVTCGRIFDVAIDLRPDSETFRKWTGVELDAKGLRGLFIPTGCAHGFLTREPDSDVLYMIDRDHVAGLGRGVRWDDPAFAISWPQPPELMSERDATWPDFVSA